MTELTKPVHRITKKLDRNRPIIVTLAPAGSHELWDSRLPWIKQSHKRFEQEHRERISHSRTVMGVTKTNTSKNK